MAVQFQIYYSRPQPPAMEIAVVPFVDAPDSLYKIHDRLRARQ